MKRKSNVRRFLEDVSVHIDGCWHWLGDTNKAGGYGAFYTDNKRILAHRYMWELVHDQLAPPDKVIMHSCDNTICVNPDHLKLGTQVENIIDMVSKDRHYVPKGTASPISKVTADLLFQARRLRRCGMNTPQIADKLGLGVSTIGHMLTTNSRYLKTLDISTPEEDEPGYGHGI